MGTIRALGVIRLLAPLLVLWLIAAPAPARADELRPGYLELSEQGPGQWLMVWKAPLTGGVRPTTQPVLPRGCAMRGAARRELSGAAVITTSRVDCTGPVAGGTIGLSDFGTSSTDVLVRVAPLGRPVQAFRLTADAPLAAIPARADRWQVARTYFLAGVDHILFGYDHLLFVIALVLLLSGAWTVAKAVTAFTIAHSLTLIGTTLGMIGLPQRPVEAVIALSIVFLAVEVLKKRPGEARLAERIPWLVAFLFGLLHGFGFAGALIDIGLPEGDVPTALLTFNLGVEAGQLLIVAATMAALWAIGRVAKPLQRPAVVAASYAIGITASAWFIERTIA